MAEWSCSGLQIRPRRFDSDLSLQRKEMKNITKAIIPVAGLGTRMLPATKAIPKELLPIIDKPLIQYVVEEAVEAGIKEIIFITRSGKEAIENHFDINFELEHHLETSGKKRILKSVRNLIPKGVTFSSVRQEKALGLGHAILCAKHLIGDEDFAVLLPDEILLPKKRIHIDFKRMMEFYAKTGIGNILVEKVKGNVLHRYGIIDINKKNLDIKKTSLLIGLIEKPVSKKAPSNYRVVGRYLLPNEILFQISKESIDKFGEIQLTNSIDKLIKSNLKQINAVLSNSNIFDCGSKEGFLGANIAFALRNEELKKYIKKTMF